MAYRYSKLDLDNLAWFPRDLSVRTLVTISVIEGHLRGLSDFQIDFKYPISAIAGKNCSGKSTILALAACAFHNSKEGFVPPKRNLPYYTFSDFFVQTSEEVPPEGIIVRYQILNDNWAKSKSLPDGRGAGWQYRRKGTGGKWNKYARRVRRNVVYFGVNRVVPHSEISVSRSYRKHFAKREIHGWEKDVKRIVGRILNRRYEDFWYKEHTRHRLPLVATRSLTYSGFNMGAGENALFDIFSTIFACPRGVLLIIDEIELGLHEEAQSRLIEELKELCKARHVQIICTTHSHNILRRLPPEGRFFIEKIGNSTIVSPGISPEYAAGKLAGENTNELDIYVEDLMAKYMVESVMDNDTRTRANIIPIGSSSAVLRQLSARYRNLKEGDCIAILDGDKAASLDQLVDEFLRLLESVKDKRGAAEWIRERLCFLPGDTWPENWILSQCTKIDTSRIEDRLILNNAELGEYIEEAIQAGKHREFPTIANRTNLEEEYLKQIFSGCVASCTQRQFVEILSGIERSLSK